MRIQDDSPLQDAVKGGNEDSKDIGTGMDSVTAKDTNEDPSMNADDSPEEGTPEYIRRKYFPSVSAQPHPDLEWMVSPPSSQSLTQTSGEPETLSTLRFSLTGTPIPPSLSSSLPTHLGLHHHAEGTLAGYTLEDLFWITGRSSVVAQRAMGMRVLAGVGRWVVGAGEGSSAAKDGRNSEQDDEMREIQSRITSKDKADLRVRILATAGSALTEKGALGAHAVECVWVCVVHWPVSLSSSPTPSSSLSTPQSSPPSDPLKPLISPLLTQLSALLQSPLSSSSSLYTQTQLLEILAHLARAKAEYAEEMASTNGLVEGLLKVFVAGSFTENGKKNDNLNARAVDILTTLVCASRKKTADCLVQFADGLLRWIWVPGTTAIQGEQEEMDEVDTPMLSSVLRFYSALAAYGMYAHLAGNARELFAVAGKFVLSSYHAEGHHQWLILVAAYTGLLENWLVCATDPHRTTPSHEILWSQVSAWGWGAELLEIRGRLASVLTTGSTWASEVATMCQTWTSLWNALAAWLEGSRVNGVRAGEAERAECIAGVKDGFTGGAENTILNVATQGLIAGLASDPERINVSEQTKVLTAAIRLWVACLLPAESSTTAPPFDLPFSLIAETCAKLVVHPLWSRASPHSQTAGEIVFLQCKPLSGLLAGYVKLSRHLPGISADVWMARALSVLSRLLPGDEEFALEVVDDLLGMMVAPGWASARGLNVPDAVWGSAGGMGAVIRPFLRDAVRPQRDVQEQQEEQEGEGEKESAYLAPACSTPRSISLATTQRFPPLPLSRGFGLPVRRDWTFSPLDHLLRSGVSPVFKTALPASYDVSETQIVRAALTFTKITRELLSRFSFPEFVLSREEAVFGCMKVFMLEHGQQAQVPQKQSNPEAEVFRDEIVENLMEELLRPYTVQATFAHTKTAYGAAGSALTPVIPPAPGPVDNLETISQTFLGSSTPFYQYYTDFVGLYDAISFSSPLFARLLLPPTSMRYAVDYRKHLWNDYAHVLRSIRTEPNEVLAGDSKEYLWPVETDAQMISAYLGALVKEGTLLQGFVRLIAVHHVACNVWSDLWEDDGAGKEERAAKLLKAVVGMGGVDVVREVVTYVPSKEEHLPSSHMCFVVEGEVRRTRLKAIEKWGGAALSDRLGGLFA